MSLRFLLDTNVLSEPTRPIPNANVVKMLERYKEEVTTATVVFHELLFGCKRLPESRKRRILESYLYETVRAQIPLLPVGWVVGWCQPLVKSAVRQGLKPPTHS